MYIYMYISIRPLFVVAAWHWGSELFNSIMMYVYTYIYMVYIYIYYIILTYIDVHVWIGTSRKN